MRILCLHGLGTNAAIFESQTVGFRSLLPSNWQWCFVNGEEVVDPAPGIELVYPGPYLAWYIDPTLESCQDLLTLIDEVIEQEGPFDAVMGFSQGGAVAASFILKCQLERPYEAPPFRFAIFLCASLPFSWSGEYGFEVTPMILRGRSVVADFGEWQRGSLGKVSLSEEAISGLPPQMQAQARQRLDEAMTSGRQSGQYRRFHAEAVHDRIQLPTVHVYGTRDEAREQSVAASALCHRELAQILEHDGGHEVPKGASQTIARLVQKAATRAELMI